MVGDSVISDNRAEATQPGQHAVGGGVGTASGGATTIVACAVTGNRATASGSAGATIGAGIGTVEGQTDVVSSTVSENVAFATSLGFGSLGGGIAIQAGDLSISASTVSGNEATGAPAGFGGGVGIDCDTSGPCGSVSLSASTINGNEAFSAGVASGGGVYVTGGALVLANCTLTDNSAKTGFVPGVGVPEHGSGLAVWGANATIANVTVEAGVGLSGIDFQSAPVVTFRNTIVADSCSGSATVIADAHNLESPGDTCGFSGSDLTGVDPLLGPLADNGGPTETMALLPGSPAINGGHPAAPGSGGDACESGDQRGVARPIGTRCDVGAYESDCGDGGGDPGEGCDDGLANGSSGSCCSAACLLRPNGSSCEDGNVCTRPDTCQAGTCTTGPCGVGACTLCGGTCSDAGGPCQCVF
jgi:hypothetical protein